MEDEETRSAFEGFLQRHGPFDVVHFHNLEGLPASVLKLRERLPKTRFVLTLHNYYPFCPQVNLWRREEECCDDFRGGRECLSCLPVRANPEGIRRLHAASGPLKAAGVRPGTRAFSVLHFGLSRLLYLWEARRASVRGSLATKALGKVGAGERVDTKAQAAHFGRRRATFVESVNRYCDAVLAVSDRTRDISIRMGLEPSLVETSYIGSKSARRFADQRPRARQGMIFTLAYLGYMRRDKGFDFLLDALEKLPRSLSSRLNLIVAAPAGPASTMRKLERLAARLDGLVYQNGFKHEELDDLLQKADCGVVPVLWEDNLPQVALEMHSRKVPLLVSDRGGARELGGAQGFVFKAGDVGDFHQKLADLIEGRRKLSEYWAHARRPMLMEEHVASLLDAYSSPARPGREALDGRDEAHRPGSTPPGVREAAADRVARARRRFSNGAADELARRGAPASPEIPIRQHGFN